jgi:uncharacterized membrane protein
MEKINWGRVVLGGFLAGVVLIVLATVSTAFLVGQSQVRAETHGAAALFFAFVFIFLGMLMTALYAAFRPRFGAGPRTAALAGFALWLTGICLSLVGFALKTLAMGEPYPLPSGPVLPCVFLIVIIASTGIGACLYKEQTV